MSHFPTSIILIGAILSGSQSLAQDLCSVVLTSKAFDIAEQSTTLNISFQKKEDLCRKEYRNAQEFRQEASNAGFSGSYMGLELGASGGQSSASGTVNFRSEAFCQANQEQFSQQYSSSSFMQVASIAVRAWENCVMALNTNSVWMKYNVAPDGSGMTGTIYRRAVSGSPALALQGLGVQGQEINDGDVSCTIEETTITPNYFQDHEEILFSSMSENFSCNKPVGKRVSIAFNTDADALPWVELPSAEGIRNADIVAVAQRLNEIHNELLGRLSDQNIDFLGQINAVTTAAQDLNLKQTVLDQKQTNLDSKISSVTSLSLLGQIQGQAICTALSRTTHPAGGWSTALPRNCSEGTRSCQELCANLREYTDDGQVKSAANRATVGALHIYGNQPAGSNHQVGLKTYIYQPSDYGRRFCGPNVCCCHSW